MGYFSDSDSSSEDFSVCSDVEEYYTPPPKINSSQNGVSSRKARSTPGGGVSASVPSILGQSVIQGSNDDGLAALMSLRCGLGMNEDPEFLQKEREQEKLKAKQARKDQRANLAKMSLEDRVQHETSSVTDMMSKIREKRAKALAASATMG